MTSSGPSNPFPLQSNHLISITLIAVFTALIFITYSFIGTIVFSLFFYYAARPIFTRINRHIRWRGVSAAVSILIFVFPVVILLAYTISLAYSELRFISNTMENDIVNKYIQIVTDRTPEITDLVTQTSVSDYQQFIFSLTDYIGVLTTLILHLFVMFAVTFYLLRDGPRLRNWIYNTFTEQQTLTRDYLEAVDNDFNSIFFGNILNAVITGLIAAVSYNVLNFTAPQTISIPAPTLLGLLTAVASLIPVIGIKLVYIPVTAYLTARTVFIPELEPLTFPIIVFLVSIIIVDTIPDIVLRPYVSGRNLHIGMVMVSYVLGPLFFGWYGLFLGPTILVLLFNFFKIVLPEITNNQDTTDTLPEIILYPPDTQSDSDS